MGPSLLGWWAVEADGELVALIREVHVLRRVEALWRAAGCKVKSTRAETRPDVQRLQRAKELLDVISRGGLSVLRPSDAQGGK